MIEWIKKFFVSFEGKTIQPPKCQVCGLNATNYMLIDFKTLELEEIEEKILMKMCNHCSNDVMDKYNPERNPAPVIKWNKEE
jgi:tyrosine-protein phosphatase YwqE